MASARTRDGDRTWLYAIERLFDRWELTPVRVSAIYLVFGLVALFVSDVLLVRSFSEPLLGRLQAVKGGVEVVVTAGFIFLLTRASRIPLERTNRELGRQREELRVLHRVLRHNLRNDLNVIGGYAEELRRAAASDDARTLYERIDRRIDGTLNYTEQAGRIRHVTEGNGRDHALDLARAFPALLDRHDDVDDGVDVHLDVPEDAVVEVNHMFVEAMEELVTNAVVHSDADRPSIEVAVDTDVGPAHVTEITISDDGPGVPEHTRNVMSSADEDQLVHLDGMGLWFVHWTVIDSRGELSIESDDHGGTTVRIRVPKAPSALGDGLLDAARGVGS